MTTPASSQGDPADAGDWPRDAFARHGLHPGEEELAVFAMLAPLLRAKADRVFEVELGDEP